MADSKLITCVFVFLAMLVAVMEALPVGNARNRRNAHTLYSDLVDATTRCRTLEDRLLNNFKADRLPNLTEVTGVTVTNLRLSEDITITFRSTASPSQLLTTYRNHFMSYRVIMNFVLEDERNTTSTRNFISDITDVSRLLSITITKIEDVMRDHLGVAVTPEEIPEGEAPFFNPKWERDTYRRRLRDFFVLEQLQEHLLIAENDFTTLRNNAD